MGFFSWLTNDTKTSVANSYSRRPASTVYLVDNTGRFWKEEVYSGYGEFGGKDFFDLFREMNNLDSIDEALDVYYDQNDDTLLYPNLVSEIKNWKWINEKPKKCPD